MPIQIDVELVDVGTSGLPLTLGSPRAGQRTESHMLTITGSIAAESRVVAGVELAMDGRAFRRFPAIPDAMGIRFDAAASILGAEPESTITVRAALPGRPAIDVAHIRRRRIPDSDRPGDWVSVVIPCHRQAHYLGEAIESALAQTIPNLEVIVVDDGSDDNTEAVVSRYPGVTYVRQENRGVAAARNTGLARARGEYLVFLDSDDRLLPHALETGLAQLSRDPEAAFAAGQVTNIGLDGAAILTPEQTVPADAYLELLKGCFIWAPCCVLFRRRMLELLDGFDRSWVATDDYDILLRAARSWPVVIHGITVAEYRRHPSSVNRDHALILRNELRVLRSQKPYAARLHGAGPSLEAGMRRSREYHGDALAERAAQRLAEGRWSEAARALPILLRHYPRGAASALSRGFRLALADRRRLGTGARS